MLTFPFSCRLLASALLISLASMAHAQIESASASPAMSQQQLAEEQVRQQEKQRIAGVVPNFNVSYNEDAVPLSPRQKLHIAFRSAVDPVTFGVAGLDAARSQIQNEFPGYGQGLQGYGKRWGAAYADNFDGTLLGNAIFPILFRQDPRYFRRGTGKLFLPPFVLSFDDRMVQKGQRQVGSRTTRMSWETWLPEASPTFIIPPLTAERT